MTGGAGDEALRLGRRWERAGLVRRRDNCSVSPERDPVKSIPRTSRHNSVAL